MTVKKRVFVERLDDIDRAKGLAIALVVFGHIAARYPPADNDWYIFAKHAVYTFHMAFFMFLSGVVFFMKLSPAETIAEYSEVVGRRFFRLMPAYFFFAFVVFIGKYVSQEFMYVDNPTSGFSDVVKIVLYPMQSVARFLWYIYVLLLLSAFSLALYSFSNGKLIWLFLVAVALSFMPGMDLLAISQFNKYLLFFVLGGLAINNWEKYVVFVDRFWMIAFVLFLFFLIVVTSEYRKSAMMWMVPALLSIPSLHGLCRANYLFGHVLTYLGGMTFVIYLMNTMTIGLSKAVLLKFIPSEGINFVIVYVPALILSGLLLPILIKKYFFPRIPWLNRITN